VEAKSEATKKKEAAAVIEGLPAEAPAAEVPVVEEVALESVEAVEEAEETAEPLATDTEFTPPLPLEPQAPTEKATLRFAEEVVIPAPVKPGTKSKKKKRKGAPGKGSAEDGIKIKKLRRTLETLDIDEDEGY